MKKQSEYFKNGWKTGFLVLLHIGEILCGRWQATYLNIAEGFQSFGTNGKKFQLLPSLSPLRALCILLNSA